MLAEVRSSYRNLILAQSYPWLARVAVGHQLLLEDDAHRRLTPERERYLAGEAPDLWSVRGTVVQVEAMLSAAQRYEVLVRLMPGQVGMLLMMLRAPVAYFPTGTPAERALAIVQWAELQSAAVQQQMDDLLRKMAPGLFEGVRIRD